MKSSPQEKDLTTVSTNPASTSNKKETSTAKETPSIPRNTANKVLQKKEGSPTGLQQKVRTQDNEYWENTLNKVSLEEIAIINNDLLNTRGNLAYEDVFSCLNDMSTDPALFITGTIANERDNMPIKGPLERFGIKQYRANTELNLSVFSSVEKPYVAILLFSADGQFFVIDIDSPVREDGYQIKVSLHQDNSDDVDIVAVLNSNSRKLLSTQRQMNPKGCVKLTQVIDFSKGD